MGAHRSPPDTQGCGVRWCKVCEQSVPWENFDCKECMCRTCKSRKVDVEKKNEQLIEAKEAWQKLTEAVDSKGNTDIKVAAVLEAIYDRFGGVNGFVNKLHTQFELAMEHSPGKGFVLKFFVDVLRLTHAANKLHQDKDIADMSNEQLTQELELEALRIVARNSRYALALKAMDIAGLEGRANPNDGDMLTIEQFIEKAADGRDGIG